MNNFILRKGRHYIEVVEMGEQSQVVGLGGWVDSLELMSLLLGNGYKVAR